MRVWIDWPAQTSSHGRGDVRWTHLSIVASQHHDPVRTWGEPSTEGSQDLPTVQRKGLSDGLAMCFEHATVVRGIGEDQDQTVDAAIPHLQGASAVHRLHVPQAGLCLDCDLDPSQPDNSVPRSSIAPQRQWHLGSNMEPWRQHASEPPEKRELARVHCGIGIRHRANDQA